MWLKHYLLVAFLVGCTNFAAAQKQAKLLWARGVGASDGYTSVLFSPFTHTILAVSASGECQSWPISSISLPLRETLGGTPFCSVLTKAGSELILGMGGGGIYAWDLTNDTISFIADPTSGASIEWIGASPDGNLIAVCSTEEKVLHVYNRSAGKDIITLPNSIGAVSFSADGKLLLAGSNSSLVLIDMASLSVTHSYSNIVNTPGPVAFDPQLPGVFVAQDNYFWEMDTSGQVIAKLSTNTTSYNNSVAFSPSGNLLAVATGGAIDVVNMETQTVRMLLGGGSVTFVSEDTIASDDEDNIRLLSVSESLLFGCLTDGDGSYNLGILPDGSELLVNTAPWNLQTGENQDSGWFPTAYEHSSAFSSQYVAPDIFSLHGSMGAGRTSHGAYYWPSRDDSAIMLPDTIGDTICGEMDAFSHDSSKFAFVLQLGCNNISPGQGEIEVWSTLERKLLRTINVHFNELTFVQLTGLAFSHNDSLIALSDGGHCYIFNINDGSNIATFEDSINDQLPVEVMSFLPGDTSLLMRGYEVRSLNGTLLRYMPSDRRAEIIRLPDGTYMGGFNWSQTFNWPDSNVTFFDFNQGKVTNTVTLYEKWNVGTMVVNPLTGDFATGGQDLIYYKSIDNTNSSVAQQSESSGRPLEAFASYGHIKIDLPSGAESGRVFVYRTDGRCFFSSVVEAGESSVTTSELPSGVYFIVYVPSSGQRSFTKVSLFQ